MLIPDFSASMTHDKYLKRIGARIRELRLSKKISQVELAYQCGFDKSNMHRIEKGGNNLTVKTLLTISEILEVSIHDLLPMEKE